MGWRAQVAAQARGATDSAGATLAHTKALAETLSADPNPKVQNSQFLQFLSKMSRGELILEDNQVRGIVAPKPKGPRGRARHALLQHTLRARVKMLMEDNQAHLLKGFRVNVQGLGYGSAPAFFAKRAPP